MARRRKSPFKNIGNTISGAGTTASNTGKGRGKGTKGSVANAFSTVGGSSKNLGHGLKHAHKSEVDHAVRAVTKYAGGDKSYKPTIAQFNTAWPKITPDVRAVLGPAIVAHAASEISPEFGVKGKNRVTPLPSFLRKYNPKAFDQYNSYVPASTKAKANLANTDRAFNDDLGRAIDFATLAVPAGKILKVARAGKAVEVGAESTRAAKPVTAAERVAEGTTKASTRVGRVGEAAKGTRVGRAATSARAAAAETKVARGTRAVVKSAPVRTAGKAEKFEYATGALTRRLRQQWRAEAIARMASVTPAQPLAEQQRR
mgnify:CR=1 FL=1